jgi:3-oxoacyl-[acyl-carrier-protein] synthase-3
MSATVTGLGLWLPEFVRENAAWPPDFEGGARRSHQRDFVDVDTSRGSRADRIAKRYFDAESNDPFLGSKRRRVAPPELTAPEVEALAAKQALDEGELRAQELDAVFSWAAVPERIVPPSAPQVAHLIGAHRAYAVGMDAACATPLLQLELATALVGSGRARNVLLTQSHLMTRAFGLSHPASPGIGDAATAMVVSRSERPGVVLVHARTHGEYYPAVTWCRGKREDPPWWEAGPAHYLGSKDRPGAQELMLGTVRIGAKTIGELLARAKLPPHDVKLLASVQPRGWVPAAIAEAIGAGWAAPSTFDDLAHLGGCGVLANLIAARNAGMLTPGTYAVLYAQGAGFTRGAALLRW